ncbi:hypothetical protein [Microbacterium sp.]|uniref:hypothetical protein n=1 Tax=Microbacterium sp. TaxID=51671 RepID=UPI003C72BC8A
MTESFPLGPAHIELLTADGDPWLSCDDCFEQIDWVIEDSLCGAKPLPESFRVHLTTCAVCHEEARSLAGLIAGDFLMTGEEAIEHLDHAIDAIR